MIVYNFFILCSAPHDTGASTIGRRMRKQHESDSDSEGSEDVEDVQDVARLYSSAVQNKNNSMQRSIDRLLKTARAEAAAEDGLPHDYYERCTAAENIYEKPVLCSAHVVGIADPVKYRKG